jgi:hypothetical protein
MLKFLKSIPGRVTAFRNHLLAMAVVAAASPARAGWIDGMNNAAQLGNAGKVAAIAVFGFVGLCAIGYGGKMLWDKGGERGEDIKASRIVFTLIGGSVMMALSYIALQSVETLGGSAADIGR